MKRKPLTLTLLLAGLSGLLAGGLALAYLRQQPAPLVAAEAPEGKLVVAAKSLAPGAVLGAEDVRLIDWSAAQVPAGYVTSIDEVIGRGLVSPLQENEPVLLSKLAGPEVGGGLSVVIPEGKRAVSVKVDEVVGVAGFVLPGTRVDVLVTLDPPQEPQRRNPVTRLILQSVQVLAAGQTMQKDPEGKPQTVSVVTLLVTPAEAEQLTLAASEGRIQLALRNAVDTQEVTTSGVSVSALTSGSTSITPARNTTQSTPQRRARSQAQPDVVVETYRGGERTLSTFSRERQ